MKQVYQEMLHLFGSGKSFAIATVTSTKGSTPREVGAKMLILSDGSIKGTIGGGCGEAEVWQAAMEVMKTKESQLVTVDLTNDLEGDTVTNCHLFWQTI